MIAPGTIAIREGTVLPELLSVDRDSFAAGWASLGDNFGRKKLETALATAGWSLFCLAGAVSRGRAFGSDRPETIRAASKRLLAGTTIAGANCVEIDQVARRSFLGIPWMTVAGHASQIQAGTSPFMRKTLNERGTSDEHQR